MKNLKLVGILLVLFTMLFAFGCEVEDDDEETVSVTGVTLTESVSVEVGANSTLTATVAPSNASNSSVTYESNDTDTATVSTAGVVTGVAAGSATITVTTDDGGFEDTCDVTVTAAANPVVGTDGSVRLDVDNAETGDALTSAYAAGILTITGTGSYAGFVIDLDGADLSGYTSLVFDIAAPNGCAVSLLSAATTVNDASVQLIESWSGSPIDISGVDMSSVAAIGLKLNDTDGVTAAVSSITFQ